MKQNKYFIALIFLLLKAGIHLALASRYGIHRDELYFIECGLHPDFGYVDHAPLVPWLAGALWSISDSLFLLRFPSALAGGLAVALTVLMAREMGGGRTAQIITGVCMLFAPALLRMGGLLHLPVFGVLFWTANTYILVRLIKGASPKLWLLIGLLAGIGLLNKHTMAVWGAGLVLALVFSDLRKHLRTPWPWLGGVIAALIFAPNLIWQAGHDWPTLEFVRNMRGSTYTRIGTAGFLAGQVLYMHPLTMPIWAAGLFTLTAGSLRRYRPLAILFLTVQAFFIYSGGKPYYTAGIFPALFAGGAVAWEKLMARTSEAKAPIFAAGLVLFLVLGGGTLLPASLPIVPLPVMDKFVQTVVGRFIRGPEDLTGDFHDQYGWLEQTKTIRRVHATLTPAEKASAVVIAGNYGQASAVNVLGRGLPRAISGHMNYHIWGPSHRASAKNNQTSGARPKVAIAYGLPRGLLERAFGDVRLVARTSHPLSRRKENNLPIYICRKPNLTGSELRTALKHFGFSRTRAKAKNTGSKTR